MLVGVGCTSPGADPVDALTVDVPAPDIGADDAANNSNDAANNSDVPAVLDAGTDVGSVADAGQATDVQAPDVAAADTAEAPIELPSEKPAIDATFETFIGDWTMQPGDELTKCVLKRLSNVDPIFVTGIKTVMAGGSHHLIVYKSLATEEKLEPFKCAPFTEGLTGGAYPLIISQIAEEHLEFPNGVAIRLEAQQMIRMEAHYLNYFPNEITAHADVTFETIKEEEMVAEANMLFYGTPDVNLPANEEAQTDWFHLSQWEGAHVFALTGHTHQLGTNVEVYKTASGEDDGSEIYPLDEDFNWAEAPMIQYDPPLHFQKGEGFRYRCSWNNTTNKSVGFGEGGTDEMCFFWAYYYPSQGYRTCINAGQYGEAMGIDQICCPGSPLCALVSEWF